MPASRLLLLSTSGSLGGTERVVLGLSRSLAAAEWDVTTVFPEAGSDARLLAWSHDQGVPALASDGLRHLTAGHSWGGVLALRRLVRAYRPDVVNVHFPGGHASLKDLLAIRAARPRRTVVSIHHPTPWAESGGGKRRLTRMAARLADVVVVNSQATWRLLREAGIAERRLQLIPPGVQPPQRLPDRAEARAKLGIPADAFVVGSLARLEPHKGFPALIDACAEVFGGACDGFLAIGGDGPLRAEIEEAAAQRLPGRARVLGRIEDANDLYAASDVFALPSELEGFGLVYVEAAFHGVPSIGARVGGVPDAIEDGRTGLLVEPRDRRQLVAALLRLRRDQGLREALGCAARERAYAEFTELRMAERYEEVFLA